MARKNGARAADLPAATYTFSIQAQYPNKPGMLGQIAAAVGDCGGNIGDIDVVRSTPSTIVREISVSARELLLFVLGFVCAPQILYLLSRNVTFMADFPPFGWHADVFVSGSAYNHGVAGNSPVHNVEPFFNGVAAQPARARS